MDVLLANDGDMWGWWASSSGGYGLSDVAESTYSLNYQVPISYGSASASGLTQSAFTANYEVPRVNSFGSLHPGGANSRWPTARCGLSNRPSPSRLTTPWVPGPTAK